MTTQVGEEEGGRREGSGRQRAAAAGRTCSHREGWGRGLGVTHSVALPAAVAHSLARGTVIDHARPTSAGLLTSLVLACPGLAHLRAAASEADTEWSDGVAVGYRVEQQRQLGVGFLPLLRTRPVWAICVAQYTGSWGFYGEGGIEID